MKTRILLIILLVASLGVNAGLLLSTMRTARPAAGSGWNCPMMQNRFKLTPAQAEELERLRLVMKAKTEAVARELEINREALLALHRQDRIDTLRADSLLMAIALRQYELEKTVFKHLQEVKDALTPAQREVFYRLLAEEMCPGFNPDCRMECGEK